MIASKFMIARKSNKSITIFANFVRINILIVITRSLKRYPNTEAAKFMEFCMTSCSKTKPR